jgi:hypothetical protein
MDVTERFIIGAVALDMILTGAPKAWKSFNTDYQNLETSLGILTYSSETHVGHRDWLTGNLADPLGSPKIYSVRIQGTEISKLYKFEGMSEALAKEVMYKLSPNCEPVASHIVSELETNFSLDNSTLRECIGRRK